MPETVPPSPEETVDVSHETIPVETTVIPEIPPCPAWMEPEEYKRRLFTGEKIV